ncbi:RND transporter [bacterium]|nr:RND transporter [bacterium]
MGQFLSWVDSLDWFLVVVACLTLGLAPFTPPHIVEKLQMLAKGKLVKPIDWFDMFFHGIPWILLLIKAGLTIKK